MINAEEAAVRTRSSALIMTGLSAMLISGLMTPGVAYADSEANDRATALESKEGEDKEKHGRRSWMPIVMNQ